MPTPATATAATNPVPEAPVQTSAQTATDATPATAPATPVHYEEPRAGGNYLRDPVTGALTTNPVFQETQE